MAEACSRTVPGSTPWSAWRVSDSPRARDRSGPDVRGQCGDLQSAIRRAKQLACVEPGVPHEPRVRDVHRDAPSGKALAHDVAKARVQIPQRLPIADAHAVWRIRRDEAGSRVRDD